MLLSSCNSSLQEAAHKTSQGSTAKIHLQIRWRRLIIWVANVQIADFENRLSRGSLSGLGRLGCANSTNI